ncbi:MAG: arylsulfatase [Planctomycetes bacterium]|nr:arylsulfatase [Planctomycetota bacterium]
MNSERSNSAKSTRKNVVKALALAVALTAWAHLPVRGATDESGDESRKPNVILILADDMGLGDLACLNGGRNRTPNLDRLKEESVWFGRAYSASPVCAPARAALLTGRYPHRTGAVTLNMEKYPELARLRKDETTMADVFRAGGYVTGLIGKWHSGLGGEYHPLARGFDEFEGFVGHLYVPSYFDYKLDVQDRTQSFANRYLTTDLSARAVDFVRRHKDEPFFLHLAHYAPHRPIEAPEERIEPYLDRGQDRKTATIYAMIEILDDGIGDLLAELDRLGLRDDTIVIFSSDNGPDPVVGPRFNLGLRGAKYTVYEGGIHVPFMIRRSRRFGPGQRDEIVHFTDVLPTLIELCNLKTPGGRKLDGHSLAPVLSAPGKGLPGRRFWQWNRAVPRYSHNAAMREGDWKLVRPSVTRNVPKGESDLRAVLYNLASDPAESRDVAAEHPERAARMAAALDAWCKEVERDRTRPATTE